MFGLLCLALLSTTLGLQCGVGENWQPTIHKHSHKDRQLAVGLQRGHSREPIRIRYEYIDLGMSEEQENIFKNQVMPSVKHWFGSTLSIHRLKENLVITIDSCNGATVPASHQTSGLANTDFVVYITGSAQGIGFVGTGGTCLQESSIKKYPLAGSYSVNTDEFFADGVTLAQQVAISLHEITHALVFSSQLFSNFIDEEYPYDEDEVKKTTRLEGRGKNVTLLTLYWIASNTKSIFGCEAAEGLELEDYGGVGVAGSHWEVKIVKEDYMLAQLPQYPALTALTLALFQGSGWYGAEFDRAQPVIWGKDQGCDWLNSKCISGGIPQQGYCTDNSADSCDVYGLGVGKCNIRTYDEDLAAEFQYFDDPKKGGSTPYPDYCPYVQTYSNKICTDPNASADSNLGETVGASSRCIVSTLVSKESGHAAIDPSPLCYEVQCDSEGNANIIVGSETVVCAAGQSVSVPGFDGVLNCPDNLCSAVPCPDFCFGQGVCNSGVCECDGGFWGKNCQNTCAVGCKSCNGANPSICTSCYDESTLNQEGSCDCNDPEMAFNPDSNECEYTCDESCKVCASNTKCKTCYSTAKMNDNGTCECPASTAWNSEAKTCDPCGHGCTSCSSPSVCTQCSDANASLDKGVCKCNSRFYYSESRCVACPDNNAECDENGAISCYEGFFLSKGEDKTTCECKNYVACAETCNTCNSDPQCYQCGLMGASSGASCVDVSVGYKLKFSNGRITITFAKDLEKTLSKKNFQVNSEGKPYDTSSWELTKVSDREYIIQTDLKESDLPVPVVLKFY